MLGSPPDVSIEGRGGVAPERENLEAVFETFFPTIRTILNGEENLEAVFETFFPLLILRIQDICDID